MQTNKMQKKGWELVRDMYESLLMMSVSMMFHLNGWHVLAWLDPNQMPSEALPVNWSTTCFIMGLLLVLLHFKPRSIKRCSHMARVAMLPLEIFLMLWLIDTLEVQMWHPFLGIMEMLFGVLGHARRFSGIYYYLPGLSKWLINDAFYFMRFVSSVTILLLGLEAEGGKWRRAIDFLLLGKLPQQTSAQRCQKRTSRDRSYLNIDADDIDNDNDGPLREHMCDECIKRFVEQE
ncbi:uncharacterized protein LOC115627592 [Scaptodrosophila lebanonensis]|uniref:Uncharacterized protein LOC115627592 n=1 Tax=Drosophila lebanonensis TaxID=7225 RepID=A0A6J2TUB7_DROLE|nr:uncharacterized protein LOC115627592 [Scaptodrosophila lebanonensis]